MRKNEIRWQGKRLRIVTVCRAPEETLYSIRMASGCSNGYTIDDMVRRWGITEVARVVITNENWSWGLSHEDVKKKIKGWRTRAMRDGFEQNRRFEGA